MQPKMSMFVSSLLRKTVYTLTHTIYHFTNVMWMMVRHLLDQRNMPQRSSTQSQDRIRMVGWSGRLIFLGQRNHLPHSLAPRYVSTKMALFILSFIAKSRKRTLRFITCLTTHSRRKYKRSNSLIGPLRQVPQVQSMLRNPK